MDWNSKSLASAVIFLFALLCLLIPSLSFSDSAEYIYDDTGRLVGTVKGTDGTIYKYDEVGNLLSITTGTISADLPVLSSINPDILFIGSTTHVSITGQNLLTTKKLVTAGSFVSIEISEITDTMIMADITVSSQAQPGPVNLTITTLYGSASIQTSLTTSQLSLGPGLLSLAPGTSGSIKATIYPPIGKAEIIQIANSAPLVVVAPQSVTIPATGTGIFSINALTEGVAYISSGLSMSTVYVTSSIFTPVSGEQLTPSAETVSVYIDNPASAPTISSVPASTYIEPPDENSVTQSTPFSVYIDSLSGVSTTVSLPVSTYIDISAGTTIQQSGPVSIYIESPDNNATSVSNPVSTKISP